MTFGEALEALKIGNRVSRAGWFEKKWLRLITTHNDLSKACISVSTAIFTAGEAPWFASHADMLAEDWFVPEHVTAHSDDPAAF